MAELHQEAVIPAFAYSSTKSFYERMLVIQAMFNALGLAGQ